MFVSERYLKPVDPIGQHRPCRRYLLNSSASTFSFSYDFRYSAGFQALKFLQQKKMGRFKPLQAGEKLSQRQVPIPGEEGHLRSCTSKLHGIPQQAMDAQSRRSHRRTCQPTVAATSRVATILSAKVTIHASLLRGMGARGNI